MMKNNTSTMETKPNFMTSDKSVTKRKKVLKDTDHDWSYNDSIVLLTYYKLIVKFSKDDIDNQLTSKLNTTELELGDELLGCSPGALYYGFDNIRYLMTGKGRSNYSENQRLAVENHGGDDIKELSKISNEILNDIGDDVERLKANLLKVDLRLQKKEDGVLKRSIKKKEADKVTQLKEQLEAQLKKAGLVGNKIVSANSIEEVETDLIVGNTVNHFNFGGGVIVSMDTKFANVHFNELNDSKKVLIKHLT